LFCLAAAPAAAALKSQIVEYRQGGTVLEGYLAYDDAVAGKRAAVLVMHEWTGINPYITGRVDQLARMGYVAFAADIYGKGIRPQTMEEAGKQASLYKGDRPLLRARARAGLDALLKQPQADPARVAAIGYCFGGTAALELARDGAPLAGVVCFHGGLQTPLPAGKGGVKAKVLVLHGGDDPYVPAAEVAAFQEEMRTAGADWTFTAYGGAVHSFTNPDSGNDASKGAAYSAPADRRSWEAMKSFLAELFGK
jgi:dienelactone hydrolase